MKGIKRRMGGGMDGETDDGVDSGWTVSKILEWDGHVTWMGWSRKLDG
jgi:hypothetical protein